MATTDNMPVLATIKVLFRCPDTLALWGVPYNMRRDVGQSPGHLWRAGQTKDWIWLGSPGWWGSLSPASQTAIKEWLAARADDIPENPYEWVTLPEVK
jgi:hypothetical protein